MKALLIVDMQDFANIEKDFIQKIESLQNTYDNVFISKFVSKDSFLSKILNWHTNGKEDLLFTPKENAIVFEKNIYSAFIEEMEAYDEIHICGCDTDACIYKTALDLVDHKIKPVILKNYCCSKNQELHNCAIKLLERNIGKHNVR